MAKQLAAEASWAAADMCVQTHGGFGFAEEFDIERKFRETRLYTVAPISTNMVLSYSPSTCSACRGRIRMMRWRVPQLPLPACGERSTREARRVRGSFSVRGANVDQDGRARQASSEFNRMPSYVFGIACGRDLSKAASSFARSRSVPMSSISSVGKRV